MKSELKNLFSRAAAMLLMMLLTTATAWADDLSLTLYENSGPINQTVKAGNSITPIIFDYAGIADFSVTGLPTGLSGNNDTDNKRIIIVGTVDKSVAAGVYDYTVTVWDDASPTPNSLSLSGTITVNEVIYTKIQVTEYDNQYVLPGRAIQPIVYTFENATSFNLSNPVPGEFQTAVDNDNHTYTVTGTVAANASVGSYSIRVDAYGPQYNDAAFANVQVITTSGNCGTAGHETDVTWAVTDTNGDGTYETLTFAGTGNMANFSSLYWVAFGSDITTVVVDAGVTGIGDGAFAASSIKTIYCLPTTPPTLATNAFGSCDNLTAIIVPAAAIGSYDGWGPYSSLLTPAQQYTVTLDQQGGEGGTASVTAAYGAAMPAITTLPTKTGYDFKGYFTKTNGDGTQYYNADGTSAKTCDLTAATTLYAYWETITFEVDGITYEWTGEENLKIAEYNGTASSLTIPASVEHNGVLYNVTEIGDEAFKDKNMLVSIDISSSDNPITTIGARAFKGCTSLSAITLPAALTSIGEEAFSGSALTEITIPANVTSIGRRAFADCAILTSVTLLAGVEELADDAFEGYNANLIIYVPLDEYENYCNRWPAYADIIQPIGAIPYIAADGSKQYCAEFTELTGSETSLAAGWYVASGTLNYTATLTLTGDVHIILKDGCTMNVGTSIAPIEGANGIQRDGGADLTIYGQAIGTGTLSVYVSGDYWNAIGPRNLTINGGNVIANAEGKSAKGLKANGDGTVTINRGNVNATATGSGAWGIASQGNVVINGGTVSASGTGYGIQSDNNITINGGNITATGTGYGIRAATGTITLGWTNATDRIYASSYNGTVKVADGKKLYNGSKFLSGTVSDLADINGKTLRPAANTPYTNADGSTADPVDVILLDGNDTSLPAGNYIATGTLNYTHGITFTGNVNLILADGCQMNVGTSGSPINSSTGIYYSNNATLTITSESLGDNMGALNIYTTGNTHHGIRANAITINGGNVTADTDGYAAPALNARGALTINGGTVSANATGTGAHAIAAVGNFNYNGGNVTATAADGNAIYANGNYTFSWRTPADRITIGATGLYTDGTKTATFTEGKALKYTDGDNTMKLIGTISDITGLAGQTLTPYGIWGYCGKDDTETTDVDESKNLTWDIALKDEPTSATDLATTMNITGTGAMADYSTADAPWKSYDLNIILVADETTCTAYALCLNDADKKKIRPATLTFFAANATHTWATFCAADHYLMPEGCTAYAVMSVSNGTVTIEEVPTVTDGKDPYYLQQVVPAFAPVLIERTSDVPADGFKATFAGFEEFNNPAAWEEDQEVKKCIDPDNNSYSFNKVYGYHKTEGYCWSEAEDGNMLFGNMNTTNAVADFINADGYTSYVLRDGKFIRVDENQGLAAHRCVLNVATQTGSAAPAMLTIGTDVTGVKEVNASLEVKDDSFYTLDGRRISKPTKGIYINKGKKVVVK